MNIIELAKFKKMFGGSGGGGSAEPEETVELYLNIGTSGCLTLAESCAMVTGVEFGKRITPTITYEIVDEVPKYEDTAEEDKFAIPTADTTEWKFKCFILRSNGEPYVVTTGAFVTTVSIVFATLNVAIPYMGFINSPEEATEVGIYTLLQGGDVSQEKTVEITENGTTEVLPDEGRVLSKVTINTNVGGGEWIDDGKTHLFINIPTNEGTDILLYFYQSVENGVTIDWGDGSALETFGDSKNANVTHTYKESGEYIITFDVEEGVSFYLRNSGSGSEDSAMGTQQWHKARLKKVEINGNTPSQRGFQKCYSLTRVKIQSDKSAYIQSKTCSYCQALESVELPDGITSIGDYSFEFCYALANINIPNDVTSIGNSAFYWCVSLRSIAFPSKVKTIKSRAFFCCSGVKVYDFTRHVSVPTLSDSEVFLDIAADCEIRVPAALYEEWIAATNWSTYVDNIVAV